MIVLSLHHAANEFRSKGQPNVLSSLSSPSPVPAMA